MSTAANQDNAQWDIKDLFLVVQPGDPAPRENAVVHHLSARTASTTAGTASDKEKKSMKCIIPFCLIYSFSICVNL